MRIIKIPPGIYVSRENLKYFISDRWRRKVRIFISSVSWTMVKLYWHVNGTNFRYWSIHIWDGTYNYTFYPACSMKTAAEQMEDAEDYLNALKDLGDHIESYNAQNLKYRAIYVAP
jgi:hypothetical protein